MELDTFTAAYVEAALWSSTGDDEQPLDAAYGVDDIHPLTLAKMAEDCRDFREGNAAILELAGLSDEQAGHDFWLTRNGHGAGFWDRGIGMPGEKLTEASKAYGTFDLYIGDDGNIHGQ